MKKIFILLAILSLSLQLFSQPSLDGDWTGKISIMGFELGFATKFNTENGVYTGTMDIPEQKAKDLPLINIKYEFPKLNFDLDVPNGLARFIGEFHDGLVSGKFIQGGAEGTFTLSKGTGEKKDTIKNDITAEKVPYRQEEVTFQNDGITFAGTLTLPKYAGKHPAVILITGSGPQNRDEEILGMKPFKMLADYFTRNGIAVLRYDDRGVGATSKEITVNESTTDNFAGDVIAAVKFLKTHSNIDNKQIGLMGHSEGGIVAPMVASRNPNDIAFIICMAGTGVNGKEILLEQSKLIMKAEGETDDEIKEKTDLMRHIIETVQSGTGIDELLAEGKISLLKEYEQMTDEQKSSIPDKEKWAEQSASQQIHAYQSLWMKYFMAYDPAPALEKVKCPVLLLFGGLDLQVPNSQNEKPMVDALTRGRNKDFQVKIFPEANHLFQKAITGGVSEYSKLPKEFLPGFLEFVNAWIQSRVTVSR